MSGATERLIAGAIALAEGAAAADFRGPDPYDGLSWAWPSAFVGGRRRRQALIQLHARSPVDLRRLYRRRHALIPKALGIFASVGTRAHRLTGDESQLRLALAAAELLSADRMAGARGRGCPWDVQTRWSFYPAGSPNVVVTAFGAVGLLEAATRAGRPELIGRVREAAHWVLHELWVEPEGYFAYHAGRPTNIHNANLLGAARAYSGRGRSCCRPSRGARRRTHARRPAA